MTEGIPPLTSLYSTEHATSPLYPGVPFPLQLKCNDTFISGLKMYNYLVFISEPGRSHKVEKNLSDFLQNCGGP